MRRQRSYSQKYKQRGVWVTGEKKPVKNWLNPTPSPASKSAFAPNASGPAAPFSVTPAITNERPMNARRGPKLNRTPWRPANENSNPGLTPALGSKAGSAKPPCQARHSNVPNLSAAPKALAKDYGRRTVTRQPKPPSTTPRPTMYPVDSHGYFSASQ